MNKCRVMYHVGAQCLGETEVQCAFPRSLDDVNALLDQINPMQLKLPMTSLDAAREENRLVITLSNTHSILTFKTLEGENAKIVCVAI